MPKTVEFYFDFGSPTAYLAFTQLPAIAARHGALISWHPILLGGIFKAVGNRSPAEVIPKGRYMLQDLARFAKRYGVELKFNPYFPINTLPLMRGTTAIQMYEPVRTLDFAGAIFRALWVEEKNLGDPAIIAQTFAANGFDAQQVADWTGDQAVKEKLTSETNEAVEKGVFGAPSMIVDGVLYFGQDRLDFVAEALAG